MLFISLVSRFRYALSRPDVLDKLHLRPVIGLKAALIYFSEPLRQ